MSLPARVDLRAAITAASRKLDEAGVASPRHDAEILAAHVLVCGRGELLLRDSIDPEPYAALVERRVAREPLQHLTGRAYFRHLELAVGPGVFVPRPETEVVAGWVIDWLRERESTRGPALVVDLCAGSGAIALSVATEVAGTEVHAVEVDPAAATWAARNLAGSGVTLAVTDVTVALPDLDGRVDAVVANPPYIPYDAWESVEAEARDHDPSAALWGGGEDGLDVVRAVERTAARLLRPGGVVAVEHADAQGEAAPAIFVASGAWAVVRDHRDLSERPRYTTATRR